MVNTQDEVSLNGIITSMEMNAQITSVLDAIMRGKWTTSFAICHMIPLCSITCILCPEIPGHEKTANKKGNECF